MTYSTSAIEDVFLEPEPIGFLGGFTVLMSVYVNDKPDLLKRAIDSVLNNKLRPDEFIIVLDGYVGPDIHQVIGWAIAQSLVTIEVIDLKENFGLATALNIGISKAKFNWIVRADADDINALNRFEKLASMHLRNPMLSLIGGWILEVSEAGDPLSIRKVPSGFENINKFAKKRNPFNHMTVAFRKQDVIALGGYPSVYLREDYALWCKMIKNGLFCDNTPEILVFATAGAGMYARRGGIKYATAEFQMQKYLVDIGMKNIFCGFLDGLYRGLIFILPNQIRGYIYEKILRTPSDF